MEKKYTQEEIDQARNVIQDYSKNWDKYADIYAGELYRSMHNSQMIYQPTLGKDYTQSTNTYEYIPDQSKLKEWLQSPGNHEQQLRGVSQYLENVIMQYNRTMNYFAKALLFRYDMRPIGNPKTSDEWKTWESGYNRCNEFLRKMNVTYQFQKIVDKAMSEGGMYTYLREGKDYATLIEIPSNYCYITGQWDLGWTFAIDLTWFDRILGIEESIPELYEYYQTFVDIRRKRLKGAIELTDEELKQWQYYKVPVDKGFVFSFDLLRAQLTPPLKALFRDALAVLEYKDLLKAKCKLDTWKMIPQIIPKDKDNNPVIPEQTVAKFIAQAQKVMPAGVVTFATPMDVKELSFNNSSNQNNIIGLGEQSYWRSAGINGVILDSGDKTSAAVKVGVINDYGFIQHLYRQFENFLNLQLYLKSKIFRFQVKFYGNRYTETEDVKDYSELVSKLNFPVGKMFALAGYEPFEIDGVLAMEDRLKWKDKMKPILSAFNTKGLGVENKGSPEKDQAKLTDSGNKQKDYDTNATTGKV